MSASGGKWRQVVAGKREGGCALSLHVLLLSRYENTKKRRKEICREYAGTRTLGSCSFDVAGETNGGASQRERRRKTIDRETRIGRPEETVSNPAALGRDRARSRQNGLEPLEIRHRYRTTDKERDFKCLSQRRPSHRCPHPLFARTAAVEFVQPRRRDAANLCRFFPSRCRPPRCIDSATSVARAGSAVGAPVAKDQSTRLTFLAFSTDFVEMRDHPPRLFSDTRTVA